MIRAWLEHLYHADGMGFAYYPSKPNTGADFAALVRFSRLAPSFRKPIRTPEPGRLVAFQANVRLREEVGLAAVKRYAGAGSSKPCAAGSQRFLCFASRL